MPSGSSPAAVWTKVSGPGEVSFADATSPVTAATFSAFGKYVLRLTGSDSVLVNGDDVVVELKPAANAAPLVVLGPSQTVRVTNTLALTGTVSDDGLPLGSTLGLLWQKVSGPGPIYFTGATNMTTNRDTSVRFVIPGSYVLRLTANDSQLRTSADLAVAVLPDDDNLPPSVDAGPDFSAPTYLPQHLLGTVTDDGLPPNGFITTAWTKVSGPANVYFGNAAALDTTATFYVTGVYVLRLTATDGRATRYDDVTVTVTPAPNEPPFAYAGEDVTVVRPKPALLAAAVFDDNLPVGYPLDYQWTMVSGPGVATVVPASGVASNLYINALANFSATGTYVLRLTATDSQFTDFDEVTVTVLPGTNAPPLVNAGPDLTAVLSQPAILHTEASDDGLETGLLEASWSQVSGSGAAYFSTVDGVYQASFSAAGDYVLRLTASDGTLSASDDVAITVYAATNPPLVQILSPLDAASITAPTVVTGTVSSDILQRWTLQYRLKPAGDAGDFPLPGGEGQGEGEPWTTLATGTTQLTAAPLATFDPTLLLNGIYELRLSATDLVGRTATTAPITLVVERNMKVGHFTVSFNDLTIPVAGIPITIVRTYDSRAATAGIVGDFGPGWTLDLRNIRVQKNRPLGSNWESALPQNGTYCLDPRKARVVTVTLPDGRAHKFQATPSPDCQWAFPITAARVVWTPLDNTRGALASLGPDGDEVLVDGWAGGPVNLIDYQGSDYNPTLFRYTSDEGDVYVVDERHGLLSLIDRHTNTLTVTTNGVTWTHSLSAAGGEGQGEVASVSITFQRDSLGRITNIVDPAGFSLRYHYDTNRDLIAFVDRERQTNRFAYLQPTFPHYLTDLDDARGIHALRNEYDESGRLIRQIDAAGNTNAFTHDLDARAEIIRDRLGFVTVHEYDVNGNITRSIDALGNVTRMTYDANDNLLTKVDALGNTNRYTYDARDNKVTETDPLGNATTFTYNAFKQPTSIRNARGFTTTNRYDASGNLTRETDALGQVTDYSYDAQGNILARTDPLGNAMENGYDSFGHLTNTVVRDASRGVLNTTAFRYDANGNQTNKTTWRTTPGGVETLVTRSVYDSENRLTLTVFPDGTTNATVFNAIDKPTLEIDALGRITAHEYDERGNLTRTTHPDGTFELMFFDAENRLTGMQDRAGRVTGHTKDALGRLTQIVFADGAISNLVYDAIGRITATTDERGNTTRYGYDPNCGCSGRQAFVTNALGQVTHHEYDENANLISSLDARGNLTTFIYDQLDRRTQVLFADGTRIVTTFDAIGRRIAETDQNTNSTHYAFDALGRLRFVTNALGHVTRYDYDEANSLIVQTDANQHATRYEYDRLGRRTKRTFPLLMAELYAYDAAGNMTGRTDFNGFLTTYAYDAMNRLTVKTPDPRRGEPAHTFAYDAMGLRTNMTDASGTTAYQYDLRNRLLVKATPQGTLVYSNDAAGNVTAIRSLNANGAAVFYGHDALNRVSQVLDPHHGGTVYAYDAVGNLDGYTYPNGVTTVMSYDSLNRVTNVGSINASFVPLSSFNYRRGPAGHKLSVAELSGRSIQYGYDATYRLTGETITAPSGQPGGTVIYLLDDVGNRLQRNSSVPGLPATAQTYDPNDRLNSETYDANGNTTSSGGNSDSYDFEDRLISRNNGAVQIVYDGDGNRVRETVNGVTTFYLVDDRNPTGYAQVLEELTSTGGPAVVTRVYTYGLDLISQDQLLDDGNGGFAWTASFYGYDGHGNVRYLTSVAGEVTDTYDYDAFGTLIAQTGTTPNFYLYCGEQFDAVLGLYYNRARYLNTDLGRFWTRDVFEGFEDEPRSLHLYFYAGVDSVNGIDPTGRATAAEALHSIGIQGQMAARLAPQITRGVNFVRNTCKTFGTVLDAVDKIEGIYMIVGITGDIYVGSSVNIEARLASHQSVGDDAGKLLNQKGTKVIPVKINVPNDVAHRRDVNRFLRNIEQFFLEEVLDGKSVNSPGNLNKINARAKEKFAKAVKAVCRK